jgi:hypothetical protein
MYKMPSRPTMSIFARGILCTFIIPRRQMNNFDNEKQRNIWLEYLQQQQLEVKFENKNKIICS